SRASRRVIWNVCVNILLSLSAVTMEISAAAAQQPKPNILAIMGDDIGYWNISAYNRGMMGYRTPNIDRIADEGAIFTDYYGQQSCTGGRAAFIRGQSPLRTGLLKVGLPSAKEGLSALDPTIAELLKPQGYVTANSARTTSATATSSCRRCTGSMSSSAISITSMPKRSPSTRIIRKIQHSERNLDPMACSNVLRRQRTHRAMIPASVRGASRDVRIQVRSQRSAWRRSMKSSSRHP